MFNLTFSSALAWFIVQIIIENIPSKILCLSIKYKDQVKKFSINNLLVVIATMLSLKEI
jgi:hypothetical protein